MSVNGARQAFQREFGGVVELHARTLEKASDRGDIHKRPRLSRKAESAARVVSIKPKQWSRTSPVFVRRAFLDRGGEPEHCGDRHVSEPWGILRP